MNRWLPGVRLWLVGLLLMAAGAAAAWPTRPVRLIVPAAPGSAPDVAARAVSTKVAALLRQPVVVENRVGAGGIPAMQALQNARDDHAFLMVITSSVLAPLTFKSATGLDYLRDVQPVGRLAFTPLMIVGTPDGGLRTLADVVRAARENPGGVVFATPNPNSLGHLAVALLSQTTGARFNVVPFSRPSDSLGAVSSGEARLYVDGVSVVLPLLRGKRLQPIALLARSPLPGLEGFPLGSETVPALEVLGQFGVATGKDTPRAAVAEMGRVLVAALGDPEVEARLQQLGLYAQPGGPAEYQSVLQQEIRQWSQVLRQAGVQPE